MNKRRTVTLTLICICQCAFWHQLAGFNGPPHTTTQTYYIRAFLPLHHYHGDVYEIQEALYAPGTTDAKEAPLLITKHHPYLAYSTLHFLSIALLVLRWRQQNGYSLLNHGILVAFNYGLRSIADRGYFPVTGSYCTRWEKAPGIRISGPPSWGTIAVNIGIAVFIGIQKFDSATLAYWTRWK